MADDRHLAQSSLHREGVLVGGHAAVWGSFWDSAARAWGYSCCQSTVRGATCPHAAASSTDKAAAPSGDEAEDRDEADRAMRDWRAARLLDEAPPETLRPRSECGSDEEYLALFVLYWFHSWTRGAPGAAPPEAKAQQASREALLPLLQQLKRGAVQRQLLEGLVQFAELASAQEYAKANDVYIGITIGKALWHNHLDLGEQRAHWGGGCSLRTMQRQVVEKDHKNASLFDTDPVVQRYVHALKRLVTYMQVLEPAADPSKVGHAPAPRPDASELGLPVFLGCRDTDGRRRGALPEYAEPDDPKHTGAASVRGLAFGARVDGTGAKVPTGRNSHPFSAV